MDNLILTPPVAFIIVLTFSLLLAAAMSRLSIKVQKRPDDIDKAYACGEDMPQHSMQPDYSQFFPFAFFFTILHVIALMVTTVPVQTLQTFTIAVIYILGAIVALSVLFRREDESN